MGDDITERFTEHKPQRNKSIELLRIVLMLMIIASHIGVHGGIIYDNFGLNSAFLSAFSSFGNLAVNVFIIITGYYSLQSKFNYKKIIRLVAEVTFYQIILNTISLICGSATFSINFLLSTLLPIFFGGGYWFIVKYLQLYLIIPILNVGLKSVGKNIHLLLVVIFGIMFSVFPFIISQFFTVQDFDFNKLVWFVWLYSLGVYMGLYGSILFKKKKLTIILLVLSVAALIIFVVIRNYYSFNEIPSNFILKIIRKASSLFGEDSRNTILIVIISVLLFCAFQNLTIKLPNIVYPIAGSVFGVYILHDNGAFKSILWKTLLGTTRMQNSAWFPLYAVGITVLIFAVCCLIDMTVKKYIFKPLYSKLKL